MKVVFDADARRSTDRPSVVTIGVFDGLHRGHQRVIEQLRFLAQEHDALSTVVSFDPHPASVLDSQRAPLRLGTLDQRLEGLAALGVDQVRMLTFDEGLARESALSFIGRVLVDELATRDVVVGENFRFGYEREGSVELLRAQGTVHRFDVHPTLIYGDGQPWSSTAVRRALSDGDLPRANTVLGRPFTLRGVVVHGDARGSELGYPTANLALAPSQQSPARGIYAGALRTPERRWWPAAISIGTRPQFYDDGALLVEAHVVGYQGQLYDETVDIAFLSHLRSESKFSQVSELIAQIDRDVAQTIEVFEKFSPETSALLG